ncbi:peptidase T-like protein [Desulforamulus reducens MI-1]|uniref:Peptidase T-like protein n=1 Tax=Desulforamulus reducens (strain ATCC BAA-1160 / DSM 100696 / MI-1) TaxID=349161 RepID=A4J3H4_DESRM|nr:M20/M25/M40 family metallo-hydrolase [Desulforamulus reducens]ABO49627.1 peptidase T-like protein [Desulforamulus reducens MI-1]
MVNKERIIHEFLEMVQVDSESGAERQIADLLKDKLTVLGLEVVEDNAGSHIEVGQTTGNIIGTLPANGGKGPLLLFSAHMDTVKPGKGVKPIREKGIISSAGDTILGSDDKAGIAAILEALRVIEEKQIKHGGIQVVFTIAEEKGLVGAKRLDYALIKAKLGFVLDSGGSPGEIIIKAPTQYSFKAAVKGKAAHAGIAPEHGINAIVVASNAIANLKLGRIDKETTANIGFISGGVATNIVPEKVVVEGEARSINPAKAKEQIDHMIEEFEKAAAKFSASVDIEPVKQYDNIDLAEDSLPVQIALRAAENAQIKPHLGQTGGGSDANVFNGQGIACANLGIGMSKVHTTEEFITEEHLVENAKYVVEIIKVAQEIGA